LTRKALHSFETSETTPDDTVSHPRRPASSAAPLGAPKISRERRFRADVRVVGKLGVQKILSFYVRYEHKLSEGFIDWVIEGVGAD
jgi:hypothetical protein